MIRLELATAAQLPALVALERFTYTAAFAHFYSPEDFNGYMAAHKTEAAIGPKLQRPGTEVWIAWEDATALGFITLNIGKQPDEDGPLPSPLEVEQIYVVPEAQGKGIGKLLIQRALDTATAQGATTLWLGVWEHNTKAQQFYINEGFTKFGAHIFQVGNAKDTDWLMKKTI